MITAASSPRSPRRSCDWLQRRGSRGRSAPRSSCSRSSPSGSAIDADDRRWDHRRGGSIRGHLDDAKDTIGGWLKDLGSTRARPTTRSTNASAGAQRQRLGPARRRQHRRREALLARLLPRADGAQPVLPAQGRADDPLAGSKATSGCRRRSRRRSASGCCGSLRGYFLGVTIVAAFNAVVVTIGGADPRRAADRDDRRRHLHRRLHPLPRRVGRGGFSVLIALGGAGPRPPPG